MRSEQRRGEAMCSWWPGWQLPQNRMRWLKRVVLSVAIAIVAVTGANADSIKFIETDDGVKVSINNVAQTCGPGMQVLSCDFETARTAQFHTECLFCDSGGLFAAILFEPGSIQAGKPVISDAVYVTVTITDSLTGRFYQFFFESDPEIGFWGTHPPGLNGQAALLTAAIQNPKLFGSFEEPDREASLLCSNCGPGGTPFNAFFDVRGSQWVPAALFSFDIVVRSDIEVVPEPSAIFLVGTVVLGLIGYRQRKQRNVQGR